MLCAAVKAVTELDTPRKNGTTLRQNLEQAGQPIDVPELPLAGWHLWDWFWDLHQARGGGFGPAPLSYAEIEAWARLQLAHPRPWEVSVLRLMDGAYLSAYAQVAEKDTSTNARPR